MSTATLISVEEYLANTYRPDCDYVDGVLVERNVGRKDHSKLQGSVLGWFWDRRSSLKLTPLIAQRIQVGARRFRVPDVLVVQDPEPEEQVFTAPPYVCIEMLSPEDSFLGVQERFDDYLAMGVINVWMLDPTSRRAWWVTREGHFESLDGFLRTREGSVNLPLADLFSH